VATLEVRHVDEGIMALMVKSGRVCAWRESGVRRSVFVCRFGGSLASVAVKMSSHIIYC
jgi:hypothetical protein